jgi:hypothetical protein
VSSHHPALFNGQLAQIAARFACCSSVATAIPSATKSMAAFFKLMARSMAVAIMPFAFLPHDEHPPRGFAVVALRPEFCFRLVFFGSGGTPASIASMRGLSRLQSVCIVGFSATFRTVQNPESSQMQSLISSCSHLRKS